LEVFDVVFGIASSYVTLLKCISECMDLQSLEFLANFRMSSFMNLLFHYSVMLWYCL